MLQGVDLSQLLEILVLFAKIEPQAVQVSFKESILTVDLFSVPVQIVYFLI